MFRAASRLSPLCLLTLAAALAPACKKAPPAAPPLPTAPAPAAPQTVSVDDETLLPFEPLPSHYEAKNNPLTEEKIALGRMLFFETRLSKNHDVSCNSCHSLDRFGVDGEAFSTGHKKQKGGRNSPTVYNAGEHVAQFWDGRAESLEEQAKGPILNPVEMAMPNEKKVVATLKSIPGYVEAFKKAFPGEKNPITYDNVGKALGAFERRLVTPGRFDKFLAGNKTALGEHEKRGLVKFSSLGCTTCHSGASVGGLSFQKLGLVKPFPNEKDLGRFAFTKAEEDRMKFRVPSLRNIEKTGPYLHDGSVTELEEMVRMMADHQLGKPVTEQDVSDIVAFLKTLTGDLPTDYIAKPELPASGPKTPKPDPT